MIPDFLRYIINFFDNFSKKKILKILRFYFNNNIQYIVDVGAHHGETITFLRKNFFFEKIYAFEPSVKNFDKLQNNINLLINNKNILLINKGLGEVSEERYLKEVNESSSSTYCNLNSKSKYYKKKKLIFNLFNNNKEFYKLKTTKIMTLRDFFEEHSIKYINYLKIDTEGFELNVIKGLQDYICKIQIIHFEHHYDDMLNKNYKFTDINQLLLRNNFSQIFKIKMFFRKSFEYLYLNKSFNNNKS